MGDATPAHIAKFFLKRVGQACKFSWVEGHNRTIAVIVVILREQPRQRHGPPPRNIMPTAHIHPAGFFHIGN